MLEYNDNLQHNDPANIECVVCKQPSTNVIWHTIHLAPIQYEPYRTSDTTLLVPICFHCADLFHDVKPKSANQIKGDN